MGNSEAWTWSWAILRHGAGVILRLGAGVINSERRPRAMATHMVPVVIFTFYESSCWVSGFRDHGVMEMEMEICSLCLLYLE